MKLLLLSLLLLSISLFIATDIAYSTEVHEDSCDQQMLGDVDANGIIDQFDWGYLRSFLYAGGPPPPIPANGDVNADCYYDAADHEALLNYIIDPVNNPLDSCTCMFPILRGEPILCGDADGNGVVDENDFDFLFAFLFYDGPAPDPLQNADCNSDCVIDEWDLFCSGGINCTCENPVISENPDTCNLIHPGDADASGSIDIGDNVYLISFLFDGGPPPPILANGDATGDCYIDIEDAVWTILFINDPFNNPPLDCTCMFPRLRGQSVICGDTDGSDEIDISDAVFLIAYIFNSGTAPNPLENADVDCTGSVDVSDAVYLIAYIFNGGPEPCVSCL